MGIDIILNLGNLYPVTNKKNLKSFRFRAELANGNFEELFIIIDDKSQRYLTGVFNLAYGPVTETEKINDSEGISLKDPSKVFSTILNCGLEFLKANPEAFLGIDGSNHKRSCLFHRVIRNNFDCLDKYFQVSGVKFYARLLRIGGRSGKDTGYEVDLLDMKTDQGLVRKNDPVDTDNLYNYFIFKLK